MHGVALLCVALGACGPIGPRGGHGTPEGHADARKALAGKGAARLVVVERGTHGSQLVLVDEAGLRQRTLIEADAGAGTLHFTPAWSPDGRWIAYSVTHEGALDSWSLWLVPALGEGAPIQLTSGKSVNLAPAWSPDGRAIAMASSGAGKDLDLWRLPIGEDGQPGKPTQVTNGDGDELDPAWSPDGKTIAFTRRVGEAFSVMVMPAAGGEARVLVEGPRASTPAWSPDGKRIAFVAPAEARSDFDVWIVDAAGGTPTVLVDDAIGDEQRPRFSADGRFVFATSMLRNDAGDPVVSTLVVADLDADQPRWRGLIERKPVSRSGVDVAPVALDTAALVAAPSYAEALKHVLESLTP